MSFARAPLVIAIACSPLDLPALQSKDGPSSAATSAVSIDELIERTNGYKLFVADYRLNEATSTEPSTIHIAFQDRRGLAVTVTTGKQTLRFVAANGVAALDSVSADGRSQPLLLDYKRLILEPRAAVIDDFEAAFGDIPPEFHNFSDTEAFISFLYNRDAPSGQKLTMGCAFGPGRARLGWLDWLRLHRLSGTANGDSMIYELDPTTHLSLSKETGFIESIRSTEDGKETSIYVLEHIDLDPTIADSEFEMQTHGTDASDRRRDAIAFESLIEERNVICYQIRKRVGEKKITWGEPARTKLMPILVAMCQRSVGFTCQSQVEQRPPKMKEFCNWLAARYADSTHHDGDWRSQLDEQVKTWSAKFKQGIDSGEDEFAARMREIPKGDRSDDDLQGDLKQMLETAAKRAFDSEVAKPLLKELDSQIDDVRQAAGEPPRSQK
jgi:hypothetical protein